MERALIKQFEADMGEWLDKAQDLAALKALAELPLQIRGFGPVKQASEQQAAKRREEILLNLRNPTFPLREAAE